MTEADEAAPLAGRQVTFGYSDAVPPRAPRRSKLCIACSDFLCKNQSALTLPLLLSAKSHARLTCSVVNALAAVCCRYQLFAGSSLNQYFATAYFPQALHNFEDSKTQVFGSFCVFGNYLSAINFG